MKCPKCESEIGDDDVFCSICGALISQVLEKEGGNINRYCRSCGSSLSAGAVYCTNCGAKVVPQLQVIPKTKQALAGWSERFIAWLIDIIIIGAVLSPIKWFLVWPAWPSFMWTPIFPRWIPFMDFGLDNFIYFLYWTFMEGTYGQSIGKMIMKIKVVKSNEGSINLAQAAFESLGKAFLLPIDCILGWVLYPKKKQRIFNYISETIVVRL